MTDLENKNTLIFIPCYNCAPQISRVLNGLNEEVFSLADVLIVDNCSTDKTLEKAKKGRDAHPHKNQITIIKNDSNYGLGGSFKNAFEYARSKNYKTFAIFHGDNQADPKDLIHLIQKSQSQNSTSAFFGSRFHRKAKRVNYSIIRNISNRALNLLTTLLYQKWISELGSGLNVFKIESYNTQFIDSLPDHIAFDLHILLHTLTERIPHKFIPIHWKSQDEKSTINDFSTGYTIIKELLSWRLGHKPQFSQRPRPWKEIIE